MLAIGQLVSKDKIKLFCTKRMSFLHVNICCFYNYTWYSQLKSVKLGSICIKFTVLGIEKCFCLRFTIQSFLIGQTFFRSNIICNEHSENRNAAY